SWQMSKVMLVGKQGGRTLRGMHRGVHTENAKLSVGKGAAWMAPRAFARSSPPSILRVSRATRSVLTVVFFMPSWEFTDRAAARIAISRSNIERLGRGSDLDVKRRAPIAQRGPAGRAREPETARVVRRLQRRWA